MQTHTSPASLLAASPDLPTGPAEPIAGPVANSSPQGKPTRLSSQVLLADRREVEIEHAGQIYRLRLTSLGKLILTK